MPGYLLPRAFHCRKESSAKQSDKFKYTVAHYIKKKRAFLERILYFYNDILLHYSCKINRLKICRNFLNSDISYQAQSYLLKLGHICYSNMICSV